MRPMHEFTRHNNLLIANTWLLVEWCKHQMFQYDSIIPIIPQLRSTLTKNVNTGLNK